MGLQFQETRWDLRFLQALRLIVPTDPAGTALGIGGCFLGSWALTCQNFCIKHHFLECREEGEVGESWGGGSARLRGVRTRPVPAPPLL